MKLYGLQIIVTVKQNSIDTMSFAYVCVFMDHIMVILCIYNIK